MVVGAVVHATDAVAIGRIEGDRHGLSHASYERVIDHEAALVSREAAHVVADSQSGIVGFERFVGTLYLHAIVDAV